MTQADIIHRLDMKYLGDEKVVCPNEGEEVVLPQSKFKSNEHGIMQVHGSGNAIVCGRCGHMQPVARLQ